MTAKHSRTKRTVSPWPLAKTSMIDVKVKR